MSDRGAGCRGAGGTEMDFALSPPASSTSCTPFGEEEEKLEEGGSRV